MTVRQQVLDWLDEQHEPVTAMEIAVAIGRLRTLVCHHLVACQRTGDAAMVGYRRTSATVFNRSQLWVRTTPDPTVDPGALRKQAAAAERAWAVSMRSKALEWLDEQYEPATTADVQLAIGSKCSRSAARVLRAAERDGEVIRVGKRPTAGRPETLWVRA